MTKSEFAELLHKIQRQEREVREQGQREYSHDADNAFRNFDIVGDLLRCSHCQEKLGAQTVLMVYLLKHMFGIVAHVNGERSQREDVRGRLKDARMYEALLWGMEEGDNKWRTVLDPTPREHTTTLEDMADYYPPASAGPDERQTPLEVYESYEEPPIRCGTFAPEGEGGPELFDRTANRGEEYRNARGILSDAISAMMDLSTNDYKLDFDVSDTLHVQIVVSGVVTGIVRSIREG